MGSLLFCDFVSIIKLVQQVKITPSTILGDLEGKKEKKENNILYMWNFNVCTSILCHLFFLWFIEMNKAQFYL